jgi:hypothetical protein
MPSMRSPETLTAQADRLESLDAGWRPVSRRSLVIACLFYGLFMVEAARGSGILLGIDLVLVPIHEGGHLFLQFFGEFLGVAGGTIFQLGVPLLLALYFARQRQVQGTAFCTFVFFEQFLPISLYMADARAEDLPLITVGDSDDVIHDWNYLFGRLGCLNHDIQIAHAVRVIGWVGMLATVGWLARRLLVARLESRPTESGK